MGRWEQPGDLETKGSLTFGSVGIAPSQLHHFYTKSPLQMPVPQNFRGPLKVG